MLAVAVAARRRPRGRSAPARPVATATPVPARWLQLQLQLQLRLRLQACRGRQQLSFTPVNWPAQGSMADRSVLKSYLHHIVVQWIFWIALKKKRSDHGPWHAACAGKGWPRVLHTRLQGAAKRSPHRVSWTCGVWHAALRPVLSCRLTAASCRGTVQPRPAQPCTGRQQTSQPYYAYFGTLVWDWFKFIRISIKSRINRTTVWLRW